MEIISTSVLFRKMQCKTKNKHLKNDYQHQMLGNMWGNRCKYVQPIWEANMMPVHNKNEHFLRPSNCISVYLTCKIIHMVTMSHMHGFSLMGKFINNLNSSILE